MDRSSWPKGPWSEEPDRQVWTDEETGYRCLIQRTPMGHLCGYVGVEETHPWHKVHYDNIVVDVHGGPTFSGSKKIGDPPAWLWCIGFDCAHAGDFVPGVAAYHEHLVPLAWTDLYRDWAYVRSEVLSLARQAKDARVKAALADQMPVHGN